MASKSLDVKRDDMECACLVPDNDLHSRSARGQPKPCAPLPIGRQRWESGLRVANQSRLEKLSRLAHLREK
jgi:hypothetical protein